MKGEVEALLARDGLLRLRQLHRHQPLTVFNGAHSPNHLRQHTVLILSFVIFAEGFVLLCHFFNTGGIVLGVVHGHVDFEKLHQVFLGLQIEVDVKQLIGRLQLLYVFGIRFDQTHHFSHFIFN